MSKLSSKIFILAAVEGIILLIFSFFTWRIDGVGFLGLTLKRLSLLVIIFAFSITFAFGAYLLRKTAVKFSDTHNGRSIHKYAFLSFPFVGFAVLVILCGLLLLVGYSSKILVHYHEFVGLIIWLILLSAKSIYLIWKLPVFKSSMLAQLRRLPGGKWIANQLEIVVQNWNWSEFALFSVILLFLYVYIPPFLQTQMVWSGEAYAKANTSIEYALYGKFHNQIVTNAYSLPHVNTYVGDAPIYPVLSGLLFRVFGIGAFQILLPAFIFMISNILLCIYAGKTFYGTNTALIVTLLCTTYSFLTFIWKEGRPDPLVGLFYSVFVILFYIAWFKPPSESRQRALSIVLGFLAISGMFTHWLGGSAIFYLPFYLYIQYQRKKRWLIHGLLFILGGCISFFIWVIFYANYGENLITFLLEIFFFSRGYSFADASFWYLFNPIIHSRGGIAMAIGWLLFLMYYLGCIIPSIRKQFEKLGLEVGEQSRKLDIFFLSSVVVWLLYYFIIYSNRRPRYQVHIFMAFMLTSARGYVLLWEFLKAYTSRFRIRSGYILVGLIALAGGYMWHNLTLPDLSKIQPPNTLYSATRQTFQNFVKPDSRIFLGSEVYQYLYDYPYRASYAVELDKAEKYQPDKFGWGFNWPLEERIQAAKTEGEVMIIPDHHDHMQNNFFDERIWRPNFYKVGVVFMHGAVSPFPILFRNDVAEGMIKDLDIKPNTSGCLNGVLWITLNPFEDVASNVTITDWVEYSESKKNRLALEYFEQHHWFDQHAVPETRIVDAIDDYFNLQKGYETMMPGYYWEHHRTLEQAIDYVILRVLMLEWCP
jgi:hypothetical protein